MYADEELRFYPRHPSSVKTHKIETTAMPLLEQEEPFHVKRLYDEFTTDAIRFFARYVDKRFEVTGVAKKVGPDIHNKPSIEISDCIDGQTFALVIFPTAEHYSRVEVGDTVVVRANYLVMSNHYGTVMKYSELLSVEKGREDCRKSGKQILNYPLFDGEKVVEDAAVIIEDGKIAQIKQSEAVDRSCFLMPGLIDAHTHMENMQQIDLMLKNGVTGTCDVAAPASLIRDSKQFLIVPSAGMTMGTLNGKAYVKKAIADGAAYIKVLLMEPNLMMKPVFRDICNTAHAYGKKVAVHAVSIKAVQLSVECEADILIHVPMREEFPLSLAQEIAEKEIAIAPTLVMMEAFSKSGRNGYLPEHYRNAERAVKLLYENGVTILAATDANPGLVAPPVTYGSSLHREMELLVRAGMTPVDVLSAATSKIAKIFTMPTVGTIEQGKSATLVLVEGRPDKDITDTTKIRQIWVDGQPILGGRL